MRRPTLLLYATAMALAVASCDAERSPSTIAAPEVSRAARFVDGLRARFPGALASSDAAASGSLGVTLPRGASREARVTDTRTGVGARVRMARTEEGGFVREGDLAVDVDAGVVLRATPRGLEDFVYLARRPALEAIAYEVTPTGGASLRLVGRALELVDEGGAPRVRVDPPWVMGADGKRVDASLAVEGCAYDASPAAPWGRRPVPPGGERCTLRVSWEGVAYPALVDPAWVTTGSMLPRDEHTAVKLANGRVLVVYGNTCGAGGGCLLASATGELYDPTTKTFAFTGAARGKVAGAPGVLLGNGRALVLGPTTEGGQRYDPMAGTFGLTGVSTIERSTGSTLTVLASGKVLALGGDSPSTSEIYDPAANTFTLGPAPRATRIGHTATLLADGKVLVAGGGSATAEIYDPAGAGSFTLTGSMGASRAAHAAVRLANGKVLVAGGGPSALELFDPAAGRFAAAGAFADVRADLTATLLPSGNVYFAGGFLLGTASPIVERYEPATARLSVAPFLGTARGFHRVTLLDTGTLLATGGRSLASDAFGESIGGAEELSPSAPGAACALHDDCSSGICDQGVCCLAPCAGTCRRCEAGTGQCVVVRDADVPSTCSGDSTCDANGACKKKRGRACAAPSECASGSCADGVCCDRACDGVCEACDATPGTCATVAGKPHGARACASDGSTCGGACDGATATACAFPGVQTGCGTRCAGGQRTAGACDGKGACVSVATRPCPGNYACADQSSCRTTCASDTECARGYGCATGQCVPIASCDGDHTVIGADGKSKTDCTPFTCDISTNRCRTQCDDVSGCAAPFLCDVAGQCVAPPRAPSGCAASPHTQRSSVLSLLVGLGLLVAASARRLGRRPLPPRARPLG